MKKFISISLFISACFLGSCSSYDDERIWQDLNEIEKTIGDYEAQAETLTKQMTSLSKVIGSSFITLISQDADGNHVISYSDGGGETHTVTIATQEDAIKLPIITAKQDTDSKFYWAQTTDKGKTYTFILDGDGKKFPIGGTMPDVKINENGYWSVNGASTGVLANDLSNLLFKSAYIDDKTGEAVFILADGQELRMSLQEALGIRFNSPVYNAVTDYATPVSIPYEIYGTQSENAYVDLFTAYNMEVKIDKASSTLIATMKEGATEGNILLLASAGNNTVLKPIYFTYGTAILDDPVYEGGMSTIIDFEAVVSNSASTASGIEEPLGSLAGRGYNGQKKGGRIKVKVNEPCYIMGIASITPLVDYSQGNDWDNWLETMDDLHKPQLDGIGYQDLMENKMHGLAKPSLAIGKQPAWLDYMTNFNKTFADFAAGEQESYMVLNRIYNVDNEGNITNSTTYINPKDYTYIFATNTETNRDFWVQIGCGVTARRVMSAAQIPLM